MLLCSPCKFSVRDYTINKNTVTGDVRLKDNDGSQKEISIIQNES